MTRNDRGRATGIAVSDEALRRAKPAFSLASARSVSALPALSRAAGSDEAGARALFAEGRKLAAAGNYAEACPKFEDSFRLDPGIGTNFNLADCLEHIGRTASAWARFVDVAAATKAAGQVERERVARARAAALEPRLAASGRRGAASPVPGLVVARDGVAVGAASWGTSVMVDPGDHLVEATAPGKRRWSQNTAVPDAPTTVSVSVPVLETLLPDQPRLAAPMGATPASTLSLVPRAGRAHRATIAVVALGALGVVGLATGAVLALEVVAENGDAKGLCSNNNTCGSLDEKVRHDTLVSDAYSDRKLAFISAGIGGAALLAAGYLWWRLARSEPTRDPAARLFPLPLAGALGGHLEVDW